MRALKWLPGHRTTSEAPEFSPTLQPYEDLISHCGPKALTEPRLQRQSSGQVQILAQPLCHLGLGTVMTTHPGIWEVWEEGWNLEVSLSYMARPSQRTKNKKTTKLWHLLHGTSLFPVTLYLRHEHSNTVSYRIWSVCNFKAKETSIDEKFFYLRLKE